jgi:hypothetical protein
MISLSDLPDSVLIHLFKTHLHVRDLALLVCTSMALKNTLTRTVRGAIWIDGEHWPRIYWSSDEDDEGPFFPERSPTPIPAPFETPQWSTPATPEPPDPPTVPTHTHPGYLNRGEAVRSMYRRARRMPVARQEESEEVGLDRILWP